MDNKEEILIKAVKNQFIVETGKHVKITVCKEYESRANFTYNATIDEIVLMVMDKMEWGFKEIYTASRREEFVYRRGLIDYIAMNNGELLINCAKLGRKGDHTTVINSLKRFEDRLETEGYIRQIFTEIVDFCRENYYLYKGKKLAVN